MDQDPSVHELERPSKSVSGDYINRTTIFWILTIGSFVAAIVIIVALSRGQNTENESLLLSLLLTFASVSASWLITHSFYQDDRSKQIAAVRAEYEENLKMYAVKASEKLINLSNQIARLENYLEAEDYSSSPSAAESYALLRERNKSAVHMLNTLRSMNDTSLSDWEGVIGDRLDAKRRLDEQRNYDINELLETIKGLASERKGSLVDHEFSALLKELKALSSSSSSLPAARAGLSVGLQCPVCQKPVRLKTNSKGRVRKTAATCGNCKTPLAVIGGDTTEPYLEVRERTPARVSCAHCDAPNAILIDNAVPANTKFLCESCGETSVAYRNEYGVLSKKGDEAKGRVEPEFLERVYMMLPEQPWPTGTHKEISEKLGVAPSRVSRAIAQLIAEGRVSDQHNGQVLSGAKVETAASSSDHRGDDDQETQNEATGAPNPQQS